MAQAAKRDPDNPILNSPYEEPGSHYATDQAGNLNYDDLRAGRRAFVTETIPQVKAEMNAQTPAGSEEDERALIRDFMRLQESSMHRFWSETEHDDL